MSQKDRKKWLAALAIVLLLAAFCVVLWHTGLLEKLKNVEQLQVYLASHTPWSQLIFLGLQLCSVIIAPIPSNIIAAAGGAAFGGCARWLLHHLHFGSNLVQRLCRPGYSSQALPQIFGVAGSKAGHLFGLDLLFPPLSG